MKYCPIYGTGREIKMMGARNTKAEILISMIERRKPATINLEFEAAVQRMEQQGKPDPIEEKLGGILQKEEELPKLLTAFEILRQNFDKVRELYEDDSVKVTEIAAKYGVKKKEVYTFASKNHFSRVRTKKVTMADMEECPICSKGIPFIAVSCSDWTYKIKPKKGPTKYYCGYNHWRQAGGGK